MTKITPELIRQLRELSGAGMMDCKHALEEADGDVEKAFTILREKGIAKAAKRAGYLDVRITSERRPDNEAHKVDIGVRIDAGPQYTMGKLNLVGLDLEGEAAMKKMWGLKEGKAFNPEYPDYFLAQVKERGLFDNLGKLDIDTGKSRLPISFIGDYVQNTEACSNLRNIIPLPANTATATYKQTLNAPCNSHQRRGYWAEARVGRLQEKKDFQFGYTRIYIEREAVLGNFNYSEIRQGTNVTEHRFDAFYQFDKNVQLGFAALIGRPLASSEPWLTRLQFDTIYIF